MEQTASGARASLSELLDRVQAGERVLLTRHGAPVTALVSVEDHRLLEVLGELDSITAPAGE